MEADSFIVQLRFHGFAMPEGLGAGLKETHKKLLHTRTSVSALQLFSYANMLPQRFRYPSYSRRITWKDASWMNSRIVAGSLAQARTFRTKKLKTDIT